MVIYNGLFCIYVIKQMHKFRPRKLTILIVVLQQRLVLLQQRPLGKCTFLKISYRNARPDLNLFLTIESNLSVDPLNPCLDNKIYIWPLLNQNMYLCERHTKPF